MQTWNRADEEIDWKKEFVRRWNILRDADREEILKKRRKETPKEPSKRTRVGDRKLLSTLDWIKGEIRKSAIRWLVHRFPINSQK